jgi:hypothetical protein
MQPIAAFWNIIPFVFITKLHFALELLSFFIREIRIFVLIIMHVAFFALKREIFSSKVISIFMRIFYLISLKLLNFFILQALISIIFIVFLIMINVFFFGFLIVFSLLFTLVSLTFIFSFFLLTFVVILNFFI